MRASGHRNSFLIALALLFGAAGTGVFLTYRIITTLDTFRSVREELAELESRAQRATTLESRWESIAEKSTRIEAAFLDRDDLPDFLDSVEETARAARVEETTTIENEGEDAMRFRFKAVGAFPDVFTFVAHVNVLPVLLFVEEVSFVSSTTGSAATGPVSVTADLLV